MGYKKNSLLTAIPYDFILLAILVYFNYFPYENDTIHKTGLLLLAFGTFFWILARVQLGKNYSVTPKANKLVTSGLYKKIKNPIYVFSSFSFLGAILPSGNLIEYAFLVFLLILQFYRSGKESEALGKKFGSKYTEYSKNTWL